MATPCSCKTVCIDALKVLARDRLSDRERIVLLQIERLGVMNGTQFVARASLPCSQSSAWNTLRRLRKAMLIEYGSRSNPQPLTLTLAGTIIVSVLEEK